MDLLLARIYPFRQFHNLKIISGIRVTIEDEKPVFTPSICILNIIYQGIYISSHEWYKFRSLFPRIIEHFKDPNKFGDNDQVSFGNFILKFSRQDDHRYISIAADEKKDSKMYSPICCTLKNLRLWQKLVYLLRDICHILNFWRPM